MLLNYTFILGLNPYNNYFNAAKCAIRSMQPSSVCRHPGYMVEQISRVLEIAGINYTVRHQPGGGDVYDIFYAQMMTGEVDAIASDLWLALKERREMGLKFSVPLIQQPFAALIPQRLRRQSKDMTWSKLYHAVVSSFHQYTAFNRDILTAFLIAYVTYLLLSTVEQKIHHDPNKGYYRIIELFGAIGLAFYGNCLLVNMFIVEEESLFSNYDEMIEAMSSGRATLVKYHNMPFYDQLAKGNSKIAAQFATTIAQNPPITVNFTDLNEVVAKGSGEFYVTLKTDVQFRAASMCNLKPVYLPELGVEMEHIMFSPKTPDEVIKRIKSNPI